MSGKKLIIFGEMHFTDDVDRIRDNTIKLQPDIILHEMYNDECEFYNNHYIKIKPLETIVYDKFYHRELHMTNNIIQALLEYNHVVVILGDTHIRYGSVDDLPKSIITETFKSYDFSSINRSSYKEVP